MSTKHKNEGYFHSVRYPFLLSLVLFLLSVYVGYSFSELFPINILEGLGETFIEIEKWNQLQLLLFIFLNNTVKSFLAILLGFIFGIYPLLFITVNGLVIGLVTSEVEKIKGISFALAAILPHGIVEIPMVLLSAAIGFRIGYETVKKLRGQGSVKRELIRGINFFIKRILVFLLLAAIIEAFLTPLIAYNL